MPRGCCHPRTQIDHSSSDFRPARRVRRSRTNLQEAAPPPSPARNGARRRAFIFPAAVRRDRRYAHPLLLATMSVLQQPEAFAQNTTFADHVRRLLHAENTRQIYGDRLCRRPCQRNPRASRPYPVVIRLQQGTERRRCQARGGCVRLHFYHKIHHRKKKTKRDQRKALRRGDDRS